jgi:hypothetical protein
LFEDVGLDHFIEGNFNINTYNRFLGMNNKIKEREIIETKTTLETYKTFFVSRGTQKYLKKIVKISRYQDLIFWQELNVYQ